MVVKIHANDKIMNVVAASVTKAGCSSNEKDEFWIELGDFIKTVTKRKWT